MPRYRRRILATVAVVLALLIAGGVGYSLRGTAGPGGGGQSDDRPGGRLDRLLDGLRDMLPGEAELPEGFASGNGRIEATEVDVASRHAGRLVSVGPHEGDSVGQDEVVAQVDTESLSAQLRQSRAQHHVAQQESEHAEAIVAQRDSELELARRELTRLQRLSTQGQFVSEESVDQARTAVRTAEAALRAARVRVAASGAAIEAAQASIERIEVDIDDSALRAPRAGRVLYRLAEPGEVVGIGGKVLTLLDLADVYMVIFLPETVVGRVALNGEARIVLDAAPDYVIPATVSYVSPQAQFTPKQVETRSAREKLSFRVKLQIAPELLSRYEPLVKTGVPGVGYVRMDPSPPWPDHLSPKLPEWQADTPPPSN
jgi:HlyD family secretion protein